MRKDSIENKIKSGLYPSKESFADYYITQNHSQTDAAKHFNLTIAKIQSLVEYWGVKKTAEQISEINSKKRKTGKGSVEYKLKTGEYPSREDFYKYFIEECHSTDDTAEHFNIPNAAVDSLISLWGIHKSKEEIRKTREKTYFERFGCSSNLKSEEVKQKIKSTLLKKYGVEYIGQVKSVQDARRQTMLDRYGVEYILQNTDIKQKMKQTMLDRYGVEWPCQLEQCQNGTSGKDSKPNAIFENKLKSEGISFEREFPLEDYIFDFKIGDILVEIDPTFTHQSTADFRFGRKDKNYHSLKSSVALKYGYHCVHVFDWDDADKIVNIFLKNREICYARKCEIKIVNLNEEVAFLNNYHLQGYVKSDICVGLYLGSELVQLMSFGKPRYNRNYDYELLRLCSCRTVIGGAEKIFNYFVKTYQPNDVISYCDLSKFNGNIYQNLGFQLLRTAIGKHWYSMKLKKHITDNLLRQRGFDQLLGSVFGTFGKGVSNSELMITHGFVEVYDAGQATYVFTNKTK